MTPLTCKAHESATWKLAESFDALAIAASQP